jgi:hypothetical protein
MFKAKSVLLAALVVSAAATSGYAAFVHQGVSQETKSRNCSNAINCPIFFSEMADDSRRITSVSCSIRVKGTNYPDLLEQAELLQQGKPERIFLGHIAQQRYTATEIVYQLYVTQPNFIVAFGIAPTIVLTFSSAPTDALAKCSITAELLGIN